MNEFEKYPDLALWMERLANSNIEGMDLLAWDAFCSAVNKALQSATAKGVLCA